jgi:AcrR family transcriptional regulator
MSDSRSALLDAAAEEFARYGLKGARVQDIVRKAGVNERMIYHHFGSKAGLYVAVLESQLQDLCAACQPALARSLRMNPYAGMRLVLTSYLDALLARPELVGLLLHEALGGWPTTPQVGTTCVMALRELYRRGQCEGFFHADCPFEVACVTLTGVVFAIVLPWKIPAGAPWGQRGVVDTEELRDQLLRQLLNGMSASAPA